MSQEENNKPAKAHKNPLMRGIDRAIQAATNPKFESQAPRDEDQMYYAAWRESCASNLTPEEATLVRINLGSIWHNLFPNRVRAYRTYDGSEKWIAIAPVVSR